MRHRSDAGLSIRRLGLRGIRILPVDSPPPTESQLAWLRRTLDRQFVLAASPTEDGIGSDSDRTTPSANWKVP